MGYDSSITERRSEKSHISRQYYNGQTYWEIGRLIVEDEQKGKNRAEYGKGVLNWLSISLTKAFSKGFDISNLRYMRLFYLAFPIHDAVRHELSWTYHRILARVENQDIRQWYMRIY